MKLDYEQIPIHVGIEAFLKNNDLTGPNFSGTPERVAKMWERFFSWRDDVPDLTSFPSSYKGLIELKNHISWGFCPHHLLPVKYTVNLSYTPIDNVLGVSKLARWVDWNVKQLPLQEDLTVNIVESLFKHFPFKNCSCTIEGEHLCMIMRGVKSREASITTSYHKEN